MNSINKLKFTEVFQKCYQAMFSDEIIKELKEINDSEVIYKDFDEKDLYGLLSRNFKSLNKNSYNTRLKIAVGSHSAQHDIEKSLLDSNKEKDNKNNPSLEKVGTHYAAMTVHRFYEDMAKNLVADFSKFGNYQDKKKEPLKQFLFIDDNLDLISNKLEVLKKLLNYKIPNYECSFFSHKFSGDFKKLFQDDKEKTIKDRIKEIEGQLNCNLKKTRYIFLDLLMGEELFGFNILKTLKKLQDYSAEYKYEIIMLSRSTNTTDIQKALSLGASLYIPKDRIFSIPYRLNQLGFMLPQKINFTHTFRNLIKLPASKIKELQRDKIRFKKSNREWIRKLPKADIHYHFGGGMDAKLTLKLSIITVLQYFDKYSKYGSFDKGFIENDPKAISDCDLRDIAEKFITELLTEIYQYAIKYKKVADTLSELSDINKAVGYKDKEGNKYKHIQALLKNISSAEEFFETISNKYKDKLFGIKPFIITCLFNIFLEFGKKVDKDDEKTPWDNILSIFRKFTKIEKTKKILDKRKSGDFILSKLIQATHGNKFRDAFGGISLASFLKGCDYTGSDVVQTKLTLKLAIKDLCEKARDQNIKYISIRMTPINFTKGGLHKDEVWQAISEGYHEFLDDKKDFSLILTIIVALKRHYEEKDLRKNISFGIEHKLKISEKPELLEVKSLKAIFPAVVGFDLTGLEENYSPKEFREKFTQVFNSCMPITIHSGEETSSKYIWEAAYELNCDRVGHALSLVEHEDLMDRFKDFDICVELCPTSNFLTQEKFLYGEDCRYFISKNKITKGDKKNDKNFRVYPSGKFIDEDINFVVCSDDPAIQNTDIEDEYLWLSEMTFTNGDGKKLRRITKWEILKLIRNSFKYSFLPSEIKKELLINIDNEIFEKLQNGE